MSSHQIGITYSEHFRCLYFDVRLITIKYFRYHLRSPNLLCLLAKGIFHIFRFVFTNNGNIVISIERRFLFWFSSVRSVHQSSWFDSLSLCSTNKTRFIRFQSYQLWHKILSFANYYEMWWHCSQAMRKNYPQLRKHAARPNKHSHTGPRRLFAVYIDTKF